MTTHPIAPPPSLDDILATPARDQLIGRVDFSSPLVETEPAPPEPVVVEPEPEPVAVVEPEPEPEAEAGLEPDDEPEAQALASEPEAVVPRPEPTPAPRPVDVPLPVDAPLPDELAHLALSVEDVAATVVELMERAGEAHVRHLEAIETETARRCELVTAQAELDAELIRLHARREAHTILTAARVRTGGGGTDDRDGLELRRIGDSLSRFAESIETDVARTSPAHDRPEPS